ncbi:hypothetical protein DFJ74DRAFT_718610 [Hyaloraphidium curvatum]|nr:hypothetical protein DFJ74DRAFT_718610 [Hyaloraphidium curvatum]
MAKDLLKSWQFDAAEAAERATPRTGPHRRVLVLGAGVAGIATAKTFLHAPPALPPRNLLVIEQHSSMGGVWAEGRAYPGLTSNGPRGLYGLAGHPLWDLPTEPISRLVKAEEIVHHLETYARRFGVMDRIAFGCRAVSIVPSFPSGPDAPPVWHATVECGGARITVEADYLVVATGIFSIPKMPLDGLRGLAEHAEIPHLGIPATPDDRTKRTLVVHGSDLSQPSTFSRVLETPGTVAVLGFGKSALDIATHLALHAPPTTKVAILFRRAHWFWPFHSYAMATRSSWERLRPYYEHRTWEARWLFGTPWGEKRLEEARGKYEATLRRVYKLADGDPLLPEESSRFASAGGLCPVEFFPLIRSGKLLALKCTPVGFEAPGSPGDYPTLALNSLHGTCPASLPSVSALVMATGWSQASFPFFTADLAARLGLPTDSDPRMRLYRRILPPHGPEAWPHRNVAFNGMFNVPVNSVAMEVAAHWIHEAFLGAPGAVVASPETEEEKTWNAEVGRAMRLPSPGETARRTDVFERWIERQYDDPRRPKPREAGRVHASDTFMCWIPFCDDLCGDMGVPARRKGREEHWDGVHTADDWGTLGEERRRARGRGWWRL